LAQVGFSADEAALARSGRPAVRVLPTSVDSELAVAGAISIRGDVERLALWLRDVEQLRRALGTEAVGAIDTPPHAGNFAGVTGAAPELADLERCRPGDCAVRMPASYVARVSKDVPWGTADAPARAADLLRQLLAEYAAAYQSGGDRGLGALHDQKDPQAAVAAFQDMLRRAVSIWQLAYDFAAYLEEYPGRRPQGIEDRFYWTRETAIRKPVTTLHHVVLQRLPDGGVRFADKQFYASRDIEAGLLVGQAAPRADGTFDLAVSLRARVPRAGSIAGRVLRDRVGREIAEAFAGYLDWLRRSFALG
jgi:hypothetical protein